MMMLWWSVAAAEPVPVELRETETGWQLFRAGEPYLVKGAGGDSALAELAAAGGNSVRTWGVEKLGETLDAAQEHGLTVTAGIWLGHERHGFDYRDPVQVESQFNMAKQAVLQYRNHPALLLWGVGNEMEGYKDGDDPVIWGEVNRIAEMIKELDPNHPTLTVTAEVGGGRIASINEYCPAIDIHGINAYGGGPSLPERYKAAGGTKPYLITEFGPPGSWEVPTQPWGAPPEMTSSQKAEFYRRTYESAVLGAPGLAVGSYAFLWGYKMEGTATWFGMYLPDGSPLSSVDTMTELWSGTPPSNRSPQAESLEVVGDVEREPGEVIEVRAQVADPEGDGLTVQWALRRESGEYATGGDARAAIPDIEGAILSGDASGAQVQLPTAPGPYRLFMYAKDGAGRAATANVPVLVKGEVRPLMPLAVYDNTFEGMPWAPSGYMGATNAISMVGDEAAGCYDGRCIRVDFTGGVDQWGGVAWQNPPNNWGDLEGGQDVRGAVELEVWARGDKGGERVTFAVGMLGKDKDHYDSAVVEKPQVILSKKWKRYRIKLKRKDLSSLKTGFVVSWPGASEPVRFYLDRIRFL